MNGGLVREASRWGDLRRRALSALALAPLALGCLWLGGSAFAALIVAAAGGLAWEWVALCRQSPWRRPLLGFGVLYIGLPLVALVWLRGQPGGLERTLFLLLVIWGSDIGAFLVGRLLRGPKLAPSISPGKTWSGALGGVAAVLLVAAAMPGRHFALAVALGLMCQGGDLLESAIKRHAGVKDSGRLIPGHGGLLDRLDGLLAAAPVAALVVLWGRGGTG